MTDDLIKRLRGKCPNRGEKHFGGGQLGRCDCCICKAADALEAERLKRQQAEHERDSILEDLAGAEKDAKRYRWLRVNMKDRNAWQPIDAPERFDDAIDFALAQEQKRE